jgi:hypothetical protein
MVSRSDSVAVPEKIINVLQHSQEGYLSIRPSNGRSDSWSNYLISYNYLAFAFYLVAPSTSAKSVLLQHDPHAYLTVDNKLPASRSYGAIIFGSAKTFPFDGSLLALLETGAKIRGFAKRYPALATFYNRDNGRPDAKKLRSYTLVRLDPWEMVFWVGYEFGRYTAENRARGGPTSTATKRARETGGRKGRSGDSTGLGSGAEAFDALATMLETADQNGDEGEVSDLPPRQPAPDEKWLKALDDAADRGIVRAAERELLLHYRESAVSNETGEDERIEKRLKATREVKSR